MNALNKFIGFFNDSEICTGGCIINLVKTHSVQCGNDPSDCILTGPQTELLSDPYPNSRCNFAGDENFGIIQHLPDFFRVISDHDCTGRAGSGTLSAIHAKCFSDGLFESGTDSCFGPAECKVNRADSLDLIAFTDAIPAKNALA